MNKNVFVVLVWFDCYLMVQEGKKEDLNDSVDAPGSLPSDCISIRLCPILSLIADVLKIMWW